MFNFDLQSTDGDARTGLLSTPHGDIQTPIFMPVGTQGTVKALSPDDLKDCGSQIILGNTYHLMLRPGSELVKEMGGLHKFMHWDGPILTDSGGFQVFSLAASKPRGKRSTQSDTPTDLVKIDEEGVTFRSYLDGSKRRMTPEVSMKIQMDLGSDIIMAFDQCPPGQSNRDDVQKAMDRTNRWLKRCKSYLDENQVTAQTLFGIVQGGIYTDLREQHAKEISTVPLDGYAIGGLSVGEAKEDMWPALEATTSNLPTDKPRYLMGVGTPMDLLDGIKRGVDMFDCVMPTRNARNGTLFTSEGKVSIKRSGYKLDKSPLDSKCKCYTCKTFTKAYLRHLFVAEELLFYRLASLHNIRFYLDLVKEARLAIQEKRFGALYCHFSSLML